MLSSTETSQHLILPGERFLSILINTSLLSSDGTMPLGSLLYSNLVYLKCFVLIKALSFSLIGNSSDSEISFSPCFCLSCDIHPLSRFYSCHRLCFNIRRCAGSALWRASFLKATSAMTLTCRRLYSCVGRSSSKTRNSKLIKHRWTSLNRRLGGSKFAPKAQCIATCIIYAL